jgi:hypothetical protein
MSGFGDEPSTQTPCLPAPEAISAHVAAHPREDWESCLGDCGALVGVGTEVLALRIGRSNRLGKGEERPQRPEGRPTHGQTCSGRCSRSDTVFAAVKSQGRNTRRPAQPATAPVIPPERRS